MANGSLFGDIKSRFGIGGARNDAADGYDEEYDDYDEYDEYDEYSDDYEEEYDPYMDRNPVTTRGRGEAGLPRLVSMGDARESARGSFSHRDGGSSLGSTGRTSSVRSYGRTMVDSSLPPSMTAEGTAAASAATNSRRAEGLDSLFSSSSRATSRGSSDIIRNSMQLSMPGMRQLQVIKPTKYDDAESVTSVLKANDVAILCFANTDRDLMKRILDFSFGAASALDASVESVGNGVFAICRSVGLDDNERNDLKKMGIA